MKKKLTFYFGMGVTLVFVVYALAMMDLRKAFMVIKNVDPTLILLMVAVNYLSFFFRSIRWWYIMEPTKRISTKNLFSALSIGFMGNMIFPMRIGEFVRAYVIAKREHIATSGAFATIVVERVFDVICTLILMLGVMLLADPTTIPDDTWATLRSAGMMISAMAFAIIVSFYFMADESHAINKPILKAIGMLPHGTSRKVEEMFSSFRTGLKVLKKGGHLFGIVGYSLLTWASIIGVYYLIPPMLGTEPSMEAACVITLFVILGVAVPSSPGFVGPFHAAIVLALGLYGIDADSSLGIAILVHLIFFTSTIIIGIYFLQKERISMSEISHSAD